MKSKDIAISKEWLHVPLAIGRWLCCTIVGKVQPCFENFLEYPFAQLSSIIRNSHQIPCLHENLSKFSQQRTQ